MADINLLQSDRKSSASRRATAAISGGSGRMALFFLAGLLAAELAGWGALLTWKKQVVSKISDTNNQTMELTNQIGSYKQDAGAAVKAQAALKTFSELLNKHLFWSTLWSELAKATYQNAFYFSFQGTIDNSQFVVRGLSPTYSDVGKTMLALQESKAFSKVELVSTAPGDREQREVRFEFLVRLSPNLLQANLKQTPSAPANSTNKVP